MSAETIIDLRDAFIYHNNILILSGVNLQVNKGELLYLIGKTGTGKSSLLKTIYAELPLKEGIGNVAEFDLKMIKKKQVPFLRRKIGIVFQDFQLLIDRSVNDNLLFVMKATGWKNKSEISVRLNEVLNKVGLGTKGFKLPHQLSGGEQQRVSIARALINNPDIILADEPTGNLDPETSQEILNLLIDISKNGKTVIIATHDYALLDKYPSRTVKCEQGKVVALENNAY